VLRFDGKAVENDADLVRFAAGAKPGMNVDIELVRFGVPVLARVRVDEARSPADMPPAALPKPQTEALGLQLAPLNARQRERLRVEGGLVVERPGDAGQRAGLLRGDVILSLNGTGVSTLKEFHGLIERAGRGATVALLVQRDGIRQFMPLRLPR
jgi:serine protease Do